MRIKDEKAIKAIVLEFLKRLIYDKLSKDEKLENSISKPQLIKAIEEGVISYENGMFQGQFNSLISQTLISYGAKWDQYRKGYKIEVQNLPQEVQQALELAKNLFSQEIERLGKALESINIDEALESFSLDTEYYEALDHADDEAFHALRKDISIQPKYPEDVKKALVSDYTNNMKLYIKDFSESEIIKLRSEVKEAFEKGIRGKELAKIIQKSYNVSKNKARFLARQELSLLTSKYKEQQYKLSGVKKYKWSTSRDARVRSSHKDLNGLIFEFDNPPVVDVKSGRRANP